MASTTKTVLLTGATGAQGIVIARALSQSGQYKILALTRSADSDRSKELAALPQVELVISNVKVGYDEAAFSEAAARSDAVFLNTDGFALGEMLETFWAIRLFQLSQKAGVKHVIFSGLDYVGKQSNFDDDLYVGHYEGKARVQEWIHAQDPKGPTSWTIIRTGPYVEALNELFAPKFTADGTAVFAAPLGDGRMPFVGLEDMAKAVDWALSHEESRGLDFGLAIEHAGFDEVAKAYTAATGKPAVYKALDNDEWQQAAWAKLPKGQDTKIGFLSVKDDVALHLTYGRNFTNWFNLYKASAKDPQLLWRDFEFLDRILPSRDRSVEDWMRRVSYTGERKQVLQANNSNLSK